MFSKLLLEVNFKVSTCRNPDQPDHSEVFGASLAHCDGSSNWSTSHQGGSQRHNLETPLRLMVKINLSTSFSRFSQLASRDRVTRPPMHPSRWLPFAIRIRHWRTWMWSFRPTTRTGCLMPNSQGILRDRHNCFSLIWVYSCITLAGGCLTLQPSCKRDVFGTRRLRRLGNSIAIEQYRTVNYLFYVQIAIATIPCRCLLILLISINVTWGNVKSESFGRKPKRFWPRSTCWSIIDHYCPQ